ncbi:hypothetical protein GCM10011494_35990 [Novosphingobium endophyticum]|uniref:Uncharacterized protein n=1 Tax=Novosphingobium endophyticum TaxID=1955250 RepID=A0A916TWM3_9SPHN|nr:hypothetical protein GCM10011494_35990 [Novosphingobium endophyticum]
MLRDVYAMADDRHVAISASTSRHQRDLVGLAGGNEGSDDARVMAWIAARPQAEVVATLVERRIPVAPVNSIEHLLADPHLRDRASLARG